MLQTAEGALSLGVYFTPGAVSFDDVWFGPATTDLRVAVCCADGESLRDIV